MGDLVEASALIRQRRGPAVALAAVLALAGCTVSPPPVTGWGLTPVRAAEVMGVAAVNGRFLAIGSAADGAAAVWWSDDGATWPASPDLLPDDGLSSPVGIAVGPPGIVVVGQWSDGVTLAMMAWHSADGRTWERVDTSAFDLGSDLTPGPVVWTGAAFVALGLLPGEGIAAFTSPDGRAWAPGAPIVEMDAPDPLDATVADGAVLVLAVSGAIPTILRLSLNGKSWLSRKELEIDGSPDAVAVYRDEIVVGGCRRDRESGLQLATAWLLDDPDATPRAVPVAAAADPDAPDTCIRDMAVLGDELLAVGSILSAAATWRTTDGLLWADLGTYQAGALVMVTSIASDGTTAVAVGFDTVTLLDPQSRLVRWVARLADTSPPPTPIPPGPTS